MTAIMPAYGRIILRKGDYYATFCPESYSLRASWGADSKSGKHDDCFPYGCGSRCGMVETDVRMTKDGHLVLMHDESVDRTTDKTGRICDMTLEAVRSCNAVFQGKGFLFEPPATLKELLDFAIEHPKLLLNIEFKDYPTPGNEEFAYTCCDKIADMLLSYGVQERTWINSFDGCLLEHVYRRCGKQFHYHGFYPWFILGPMTIDPEEFIDVACKQYRYISESGEVMKYDEPLCPKEWFDYLHEKGITTLVAPNLKEYPKYGLTISWGAQIVCHDDPCAMLEHFRKKRFA